MLLDALLEKQERQAYAWVSLFGPGGAGGRDAVGSLLGPPERPAFGGMLVIDDFGSSSR